MFKVGISLFLSGLFLGAGPCLVSCGPFLVSFIAGNKKSFKESIWIWFIFSVSRISAYLVLGIIAGFLSQKVIYRIYDSILTKYIFFIGGGLVSLIGILMILNRNPQIKICEVLKNNLITNETKSIVAFGLVIGFLPCAPLIGIISYIALISGSVFKGALYSFSFGMGTLISPLLLMAVFASLIPRLLGSREKVYSIFQKICGLIVLILGLQLIYNGFKL